MISKGIDPLEEEAIVVELRKTLLLPLDDLLVVVREFIQPAMSRSALDRCLRRHGISSLNKLIPVEEDEPTQKMSFKAYEPGFVHVDVKFLKLTARGTGDLSKMGYLLHRS